MFSYVSGAIFELTRPWKYMRLKVWSDTYQGAKRMARAKKEKASKVKAKSKAGSTKTKKGLLSRFLKGKKASAAKPVKTSARDKKAAVKSPARASSTSLKKTSSSKNATTQKKKVKKPTTTPEKKTKARPNRTVKKAKDTTPALNKTSAKVPETEEVEEVLITAYEPTLFKPQAILLEPGKILSAEGWKRLFELAKFKK